VSKSSPIYGFWPLSTPKLKGGLNYYGAYPAGFLQPAKDMLGCSDEDSVLHVCGGMARAYPYAGFGPRDKTLDLDPACEPDFLKDAREPWPLDHEIRPGDAWVGPGDPWEGILIDPPYTKMDAAQYGPGDAAFPKPHTLLKRAFEVLQPGRRVGLLHYMVPRVPKGGRMVAVIGVIVGSNSRIRCFSVIEKVEEVAP